MKKKIKIKLESFCKNVCLFIFIFDRKLSLISLNLYKIIMWYVEVYNIKYIFF